MRPLRMPAHAGPAAESELGLDVPGLRCPRGHVNHLRARYCLFCGRALAGRTEPDHLGPRPVVGALVRGDGVRVLLVQEVAITACPLPAVPTAPEVPGTVTARIVFLGWEPFALAETPGVRWAPDDGVSVPLAPGDPAPLVPGAQLVVGHDAYRYEALDHLVDASRSHRGRRRSRLPDRALFRRSPER